MMNSGSRWAWWVSAGVIATSMACGTGTASAQEAVWDPCASATTPVSGIVPITDGEYGEFGPLAAQASLTIALPTLDGSADQQPVPQVRTQRVDGGVLVALHRPGAAGYATAVVNDDGDVRWRTCSERQLWSVAAEPDSGLIVVTSQTSGDTGYMPDHVEIVSVLDGAVTADLTQSVRDIAGGTTPAGATPGGLFFGPDPSLVLDATSRLARVDLVTGAVESRDVPSVAEGAEIGGLTLEATRTGYLVARTIGGGPVDAALVQGRWTTDGAVIESVTGPVIDRDYEAGGAIARFGPDGTLVWRRDDLALWSGEGFTHGITADTALAHICVDGDPVACTQHALVGLDVETGTTRWQLDDVSIAAEYGDGYALVSGPAGSRMIDASTGTSVDGTVWPTGTFVNECCGAGDYVFTSRLGDVVVAVNQAEMRVYYQASNAPSPVAISLF
ncbi:MAG: hypothetical protein ACK5OX_07995 [Desertimonas sp.]